MQKSRISHAGRLAAAVIALILTPSLSHAQRYLGSIQGEVSDPTGAVVPNADITAEETTTHFKTIGKTNGSGIYTFGSLNPGTYTVTSTASGFRSETRSGVVLTAGNLQQIDFRLAPRAST